MYGILVPSTNLITGHTMIEIFIAFIALLGLVYIVKQFRKEPSTVIQNDVEVDVAKILGLTNKSMEKHDIYETLRHYSLPNGSIIAFSSTDGHWETMLDYDNIPDWADTTCEMYNGRLEEVQLVK